MSHERIWRIALFFVVVAALLGVALQRLTIAQHDEWLERSYENRWAFRDVPTRRGDIVDRTGRRLAWDEPGIDLELVYRTFRRQHAVATALHGANLVARARQGREAFRFDEPARLQSACDGLLSLPVAWLVGHEGQWLRADAISEYAGDPDEISRDVRFYVGGMVAALGDASHRDIARLLLRAAREKWPCDVREALRRGLGERAFEVSAAFAQRLQDLRTLDANLATSVASADADARFDLFAELEERRRDWLDEVALTRLPDRQRETIGEPDFWRWLATEDVPWRRWSDWLARSDARRAEDVRRYRAAVQERRDDDVPRFPELPDGYAMPAFHAESRPRILLWRLDYDFAVWLGALEERHPGFLLRPSVVRERGALPGGDDLGSFEPLLGRVTAYWATDRREERSPEAAAASLFDRVRDAGVIEPPDPDVPEGIAASLASSAEAALRQHFRVFGRVGRSGVENACNDRLSGAPGLRFVERGKRARERRMFDHFDVTAGGDVELTVDLAAQAVAERVVSRQISARECALVAMHAQTGEVLAIASRTRERAGGEIESSPESSIAALYPSFNPSVGSVAKPFVALEYLESLARNPALKSPRLFEPCDGFLAPYRTCHGHGEASQDVASAVAESCNFFFYEAALQIRRPGLVRAYGRAGWRLPEGAGSVFDAHDREAWSYEPEDAGLHQREIPGIAFRAPPRWHNVGSAEREAIGYGVHVSAVDVARAYAGLATGWMPDATLVRGAGARHELRVAPTHLDLVRAGLRGCVTHGTAKEENLAARFDRYGGVYGKTGTAIIDKGKPGARPEIDNAWFVGFLGLDEGATLVVVAVAYQVPGNGGAEAGPMFHDFLSGLEENGMGGYLDGTAFRED